MKDKYTEFIEMFKEYDVYDFLYYLGITGEKNDINHSDMLVIMNKCHDLASDFVDPIEMARSLTQELYREENDITINEIRSLTNDDFFDWYNNENIKGLPLTITKKDNSQKHTAIYESKKEVNRYTLSSAERKALLNKVDDFLYYCDARRIEQQEDKSQFEQLKQDIKDDRIDCVIVSTISQLSRKVEDLHEFIELAKEHNCKVVDIGGVIDFNMPNLHDLIDKMKEDKKEKNEDKDIEYNMKVKPIANIKELEELQERLMGR